MRLTLPPQARVKINSNDAVLSALVTRDTEGLSVDEAKRSTRYSVTIYADAEVPLAKTPLHLAHSTKVRITTQPMSYFC